MRKLFIGALAGALVLAVAATAIAATEQHFKAAFLTKAKNKSTGINFGTSATDPQNTANNQQPKAVRRLDLKLPARSAVDSGAAVVCTADDNAFQNNGEAACPAKSKVGTGSATAKLPFNGQADISVQVTAFNAKKGLVLYLRPSLGQPFTIRPKWTGNLKSGPTLVSNVPPNCLPPASNQGGQCKKQDGSAGQEVILTSLALKTSPKTKGKHVLIRSPKTCTGKWTFKVTYHYSDGTSESKLSRPACKK